MSVQCHCGSWDHEPRHHPGDPRIAEIARLRKIEEAARRWYDTRGQQGLQDVADAALRAALEENHTDDPATHDPRCIAVRKP